MDSVIAHSKNCHVSSSNAIRNGCTEELFEKEPCRYLPECPTKSYAGSFNPFEMDQMSGYSSPWLERGLEAENQVKSDQLSYSYDGSAQNVPNVHSTNSRQRHVSQNTGMENTGSFILCWSL